MVGVNIMPDNIDDINENINENIPIMISRSNKDDEQNAFKEMFSKREKSYDDI
jgi:hypothetical protein